MRVAKGRWSGITHAATIPPACALCAAGSGTLGEAAPAVPGAPGISEVFKLVRIFGRRDTTDHLKRYFALSGTRSSVSKRFVPAPAHETHLLVQDFSELKILTKFDGYRRVVDQQRAVDQQRDLLTASGRPAGRPGERTSTVPTRTPRRLRHPQGR